jgi:hypothetical protein
MFMEPNLAEFKVSSHNASSQSRDQRIRLVLWGAVLLLVGITLLGLFGTRSFGPAVNTALTVAAIAIVIGVVGSAYFFAGKTGIERAKLSMVFLLTDRDLVRQRVGWPEVRIGLSEVKALFERPGWLVVESLEPRRRIAIPHDVEGFGTLRSELIKHGPIVEPPRRSPIIAVPLVASLFCWALVMLSKEPWVVRTAGCIALVLLAWDSFRIDRLLRRSPKRYLLWAALACSWAMAFWIIYIRVARF